MKGQEMRAQQSQNLILSSGDIMSLANAFWYGLGMLLVAVGVGAYPIIGYFGLMFIALGFVFLPIPAAKRYIRQTIFINKLKKEGLY